MTPTIYAVAWLVISAGGYGNVTIPMPSMSHCLRQSEKLKAEEMGFGRTIYTYGCISGQPTQTDKAAE